MLARLETKQISLWMDYGLKNLTMTQAYIHNRLTPSVSLCCTMQTLEKPCKGA